MKGLDPADVRCCFCLKPIGKADVVALVDTPAGLPAVTHLDHSGVRDSLIQYASQITTGALLLEVAEAFSKGIKSEDAFRALEARHAALSQTQQRRLLVLQGSESD